MAINAAQLLKRLEPAVRPASAPLGGGGARGPLETQSFDQLLSLASRGALSSGRQIDVAFDAQPPLEAGQLERLAAAADQAEAAGAKNALMLMNGRAFVMDVAHRRLTSEVSGDPSAARLVNIDAALHVPGDNELAAVGSLGPPNPGILPRNLLRQLEEGHKRHDHHLK